MILYLDNQASIGPNRRSRSVGARVDGDRKLGINENLAREILELHTLGVDGGYTQEDVTTFAQALTGWTVGGTRASGRARTIGASGARQVRISRGWRTSRAPRRSSASATRQRASTQPRAVLRDLARHPATARHVATKLARHFVADEPPPTLVERIGERRFATAAAICRRSIAP